VKHLPVAQLHLPFFGSYHILMSPVLYKRKGNCEMESTKAQAELLNAWIKTNLGFMIMLTHMLCSQVKLTKP